MCDFQMSDIEDGKLQTMAGFSLLECSHLVQWCPQKGEFLSVPRQQFESEWKKLDPVFGRLICWIIFSAGAEMFAKGVCLLNKIKFRKTKTVPEYPSSLTQENLTEWAKEYLKNWKSCGTKTVVNYGTLGNLIGDDKEIRNFIDNRKTTDRSPPLHRLLARQNASPEDAAIVLAAYHLLSKSIRNRDAHAYVPNERDQHFDLVESLFVRCFDILAAWVPGGPKTLDHWKKKLRILSHRSNK